MDMATPTSNPIMDEFSKFNRTFLGELSLFADCYDAFFVQKRTRASTLSELDTLKRSVFAKLSDSDREKAKEDLKNFLLEKENKYFKYLDDQLQLPLNLTNISPNQFVMILNVLRKDIASIEVLDSLTTISTRLATLTIKVLDRIIEGVFGKVNQDLFGTL